MCEATQRNHANQKVGRDRKGRATRQGLMSTKEEDEIVIHFPSPTWAVACRRYNIEHYNHLDYNHAPSLLHIAQHDVARRVRVQLLQVSARARRGHQAVANRLSKLSIFFSVSLAKERRGSRGEVHSTTGQGNSSSGGGARGERAHDQCTHDAGGAFPLAHAMRCPRFGRIV